MDSILAILKNTCWLLNLFANYLPKDTYKNFPFKFLSLYKDHFFLFIIQAQYLKNLFKLIF